MATNYEIKYYNWARVLTGSPKYESRIFATAESGLKFAEKKIDELLASADESLQFCGVAYDAATLSFSALFYEDGEPIEALVWLEEMEVNDFEF